MELKAKTHIVSPKRVPKFELLNRLLAEVRLDDYEHLVITDDDIELPPGFLDDYLDQVRYPLLHACSFDKGFYTQDNLKRLESLLEQTFMPTCNIL